LNEDYWINTLEKIKKYIDDNKKRPTSDKNNSKEIIYYVKWLLHQKTNYSNKEQIMKSEKIRKLWESFINDKIYSIYFK